MSLRDHSVSIVVALGLSCALVFSGAAQGATAPTTATPSALHQSRIDAAAKAYAAMLARYKSGATTADELYLWSTRWLQSQRDSGVKSLLLSGATDHRDRMKDLDAVTKTRVASGAASSDMVAATSYYLAEAEVWLADAKK